MPTFLSRLNPIPFLGLHLTAGLTLSVGAALVFAKIAESLHENDTVAALDRALPLALQHWVTPLGTRLFLAVTAAGAPVTILGIGGVVGAALLLRGHRTLFLGWAAALAGAGLLDWSLKLAFRRPRPDTAWAHLHGASWSFPSGHAFVSLVAYGMLAYLAIRLSRSVAVRMAAVTCATMLVVAIALSRLYLGVHYLSDVVGGLAAGFVWLSACILAMEAIRRRYGALLVRAAQHE